MCDLLKSKFISISDNGLGVTREGRDKLTWIGLLLEVDLHRNARPAQSTPTEPPLRCAPMESMFITVNNSLEILSKELQRTDGKYLEQAGLESPDWRLNIPLIDPPSIHLIVS